MPWVVVNLFRTGFLSKLETLASGVVTKVLTDDLLRLANSVLAVATVLAATLTVDTSSGWEALETLFGVRLEAALFA